LWREAQRCACVAVRFGFLGNRKARQRVLAA